MERKYLTDGTVITGRVVRLKPDGYISALPIPRVPKTSRILTSAGRYTSAVSRSVVRLAKDIFLFAFPNYDSVSPQYQVRYIVVRRQADGSFIKISDTQVSTSVGNIAYCSRISDTEAFVVLNATGNSAALGVVVTLSNNYTTVTVGTPVTLGSAARPYNLKFLKETSTKYYYLVAASKCAVIAAVDKNTKEVSVAALYTFGTTMTSVLNTDMFAVDNTRFIYVVRGCVSGYTTNDTQLVQIDATLDGNGDITSLTQVGTVKLRQNSTDTSYGASDFMFGYDGAAIYCLYNYAVDGSTRYWCTQVTRLTIPASGAISFGDTTNAQYNMGSTARFAAIIDTNRNALFSYKWDSATSAQNIAAYSDFYAPGRPPGYPTLMGPVTITPTTQPSYLTPMFTEDMKDVFLIYSETTTLALDTFYFEPGTGISLGVALSTDTVGINDIISGLSGLKTGMTYYYDAQGKLTNNPAHSRVGVALSTSQLLIDKTIF